MKFDVLEDLKEALYKKYRKNTAKTYYSAAVKLFNDMQFNDVEDITEEKLEAALKQKFKTKNDFSAAKQAVKTLKNIYPNFHCPSDDFFKNTSMKKRNFGKKGKKVIEYDSIKRKINQISNEKLKIAYRLGLVSGLRISELAQLAKEDIKILDNKIFINVRHGKGNSNGIVECQSDPYLIKKLPYYLKEFAHDTDKLFYSEVYMREKANALDFECHDMRRIYAITLREKLKKEMPVAQANEIVQKSLRHKRFSTTKRYLFNKKLIMKRRK